MIRVAIVGLGNCASSLVQGIEYYTNNADKTVSGMMMPDIGGYQPKDIEVVLAFDVDKRKVGKPVSEAIFAKPNCTMVFYQPECDAPVMEAPILDGVSPHMLDEPEDRSFRPIDNPPPPIVEDYVQILHDYEVDILINYLPVGSQKATEFWAEVCLKSGVNFLNCIPVFIASNPEWAERFKNNRLSIIGDDMKSQFGASILSAVLQKLAIERGHKVKCHIQVNHGGNTDFLNMTNKDRLVSKKISKTNVITAQSELLGAEVEEDSVHAGPSEYIPYLGDNKVAYFNIELEGFGGAPVKMDIKLSVQDSPNSAGVVIDAIRYLKVANELGVYGALKGPSAWTQKTPPVQMLPEDALAECNALANREITETMKG